MKEAARQRTVLIVDDMPTNIKTLATFLKDQGLRIMTALGGQDALVKAQRLKPDIILLDVMMPDIDGFETCRRFKADPTMADIPVIFMTSLSDEEHKVAAFEAGAIDYVTKPLYQDEVLARLNTHLTNSLLTRHLDQLVTQRTDELQEALQREQELSKKLDLALAKEKELNAFKSKIIESVNHEFRTPLTIISQTAWMLEQTVGELDAAKVSKYAGRLERASKDIDALLWSLNTTKSLTDNMRVSHKQTVSWHDLCDRLRILVDKVATNGTQITLQSHNAAAIDNIDTDLEGITTILHELLKNSIKFSEGQPTIRVEVGAESKHVSIKVRDMGIGIPAEEADQVFDSFYRASNVDARRGLGIGLNIAAQIATSLNGSIQINDVEQGTEVELRIPSH